MDHVHPEGVVSDGLYTLSLFPAPSTFYNYIFMFFIENRNKVHLISKWFLLVYYIFSRILILAMLPLQ